MLSSIANFFARSPSKKKAASASSPSGEAERKSPSPRAGDKRKSPGSGRAKKSKQRKLSQAAKAHKSITSFFGKTLSPARKQLLGETESPSAPSSPSSSSPTAKVAARIGTSSPQKKRKQAPPKHTPAAADASANVNAGANVDVGQKEQKAAPVQRRTSPRKKQKVAARTAASTPNAAKVLAAVSTPGSSSSSSSSSASSSHCTPVNASAPRSAMSAPAPVQRAQVTQPKSMRSSPNKKSASPAQKKKKSSKKSPKKKKKKSSLSKPLFAGKKGLTSTPQQFADPLASCLLSSDGFAKRLRGIRSTVAVNGLSNKDVLAFELRMLKEACRPSEAWFAPRRRAKLLDALPHMLRRVNSDEFDGPCAEIWLEQVTFLTDVLSGRECEEGFELALPEEGTQAGSIQNSEFLLKLTSLLATTCELAAFPAANLKATTSQRLMDLCCSATEDYELRLHRMRTLHIYLTAAMSKPGSGGFSDLCRDLLQCLLRSSGDNVDDLLFSVGTLPVFPRLYCLTALLCEEVTMTSLPTSMLSKMRGHTSPSGPDATLNMDMFWDAAFVNSTLLKAPTLYEAYQRNFSSHKQEFERETIELMANAKFKPTGKAVYSKKEAAVQKKSFKRAQDALKSSRAEEQKVHDRQASRSHDLFLPVLSGYLRLMQQYQGPSDTHIDAVALIGSAQTALSNTI